MCGWNAESILVCDGSILYSFDLLTVEFKSLFWSTTSTFCSGLMIAYLASSCPWLGILIGTPDFDSAFIYHDFPLADGVLFTFCCDDALLWRFTWMGFFETWRGLVSSSDMDSPVYWTIISWPSTSNSLWPDSVFMKASWLRRSMVMLALSFCGWGACGYNSLTGLLILGCDCVVAHNFFS